MTEWWMRFGNIEYLWTTTPTSVHTEIEKYTRILGDGGPVYTETHPGHLFVEPWNAISSLAIAIPAIYWAFKIRKNYADYPFLTFCLPFLLFNGLGSFFFHAFRDSHFFLYMDVVPAAILTLSVSVYLWLKILRRWWQILFVVMPAFYLRFVVWEYFDPHTAVNLSYAITGILIFLPLVKYLWETAFVDWKIILLSVLSLSLALFFREMDAWRHHLFPMGTHFLWHILSGVGGYFLALYLFRLRKREIFQKQTEISGPTTDASI